MRLRSPHPAVSAAALACAALLTAAMVVPQREARGEAKPFCSLIPAWDSRGEGPYVLGTAKADTVAVSRPARPLHEEPGLRLDPTWVPYGQVVEVARVGGPGADSLERVFARRGSRRVVVVPWAHTSSCETSPWNHASARFAPVGREALWTAELRPEEGWTDGMPTFDAWVARFQPYPYGPGLTRGTYGAPRAEWLSAAEYFELYGTLPVWRRGETLRRTPELRKWREDHPELATRHPASTIYRNLLEQERSRPEEAAAPDSAAP